MALLPALVSSSPGELVLLAGAVAAALGSTPGSRLHARLRFPFELALAAQAWVDLEPLQMFVLKNPSLS